MVVLSTATTCVYSAEKYMSPPKQSCVELFTIQKRPDTVVSFRRMDSRLEGKDIFQNYHRPCPCPGEENILTRAELRRVMYYSEAFGHSSWLP